MIFSNDEKWNKVLEQLEKRFRMKDLGQAKHCLRMRIEVTDDGVTLDQESYI